MSESAELRIVLEEIFAAPLPGQPAVQGNRTKRGKLPRLGNMPNGLFIERKPRELQALGPFSGTCQNAIILTGQYNNMTLTYVCHGPKAWKLRAFYDAIALAGSLLALLAISLSQ